MRSLGVFLVPVAIALGSISLIENNNLLMRPLLAVSILAGAVSVRGRLNQPEVAWFGLMGFYMLAMIFSSLNTVVPDAAMTNLGRQLFIMLLSGALVILFRDPEMRFTGLRALIMILLVAAGATAWVYATLGPVYGFTYEGVRLIKGAAIFEHGIGLNTLSYLTVIALFGWRIAARPNFAVDMALLGFGLLCVFLLGSRATLVALVVSWLIVATVRRLWRFSPIIGSFGVAVILLLSGVLWVIVAEYAVEIRDIFGADALREISVGRTDMWGAGLRMWAERPLFGWGPESWRLLMLEFLPGSGDRFLTLISDLESGSFHNGFVTVAAERGTVGFLSAMLIQLYLFRCAVSISTYRDLLEERERGMAAFVPVLVLFMFLRSLAESSGLFGTANGEVDYMTYFLSSYIVALHAEVSRRKEDMLQAGDEYPSEETAEPMQS